MINLFGRFSQSTQIIIGLNLVAVVALLDYITGSDLSFSIFYFIPILIMSWFTTPRIGVVFACLCAGALAYIDYLGRHTHTIDVAFLFNIPVRLGMFLIITWLISQLKDSSERLVKSELLAQRSYDVITTSQRLVVLLAKNITSYNSRLLNWVVKQKTENMPVEGIVESTSRKIGENLSVFTEICYSYQPGETELVDLETLIERLEVKLNRVNSKFDESETAIDNVGTTETEINSSTPETRQLFEFNKNHRT